MRQNKFKTHNEYTTEMLAIIDRFTAEEMGLHEFQTAFKAVYHEYLESRKCPYGGEQFFSDTIEDRFDYVSETEEIEDFLRDACVITIPEFIEIIKARRPYWDEGFGEFYDYDYDNDDDWELDLIPPERDPNHSDTQHAMVLRKYYVQKMLDAVDWFIADQGTFRGFEDRFMAFFDEYAKTGKELKYAEGYFTDTVPDNLNRVDESGASEEETHKSGLITISEFRERIKAERPNWREGLGDAFKDEEY